MRNEFRFDPAGVAVAAAPSLPDALGAGERELHIEVGFGKDIRILREAALHPGALYLGIEISRKKCVSFCQKVARLGLANVRCHHGDVRRVLTEMLPEGSVASFTILFPDPWPKRSQQKHRWIQPATAGLLARALRPGGGITVATDHAGYMEQIRAAFSGTGLELVEERAEVPEQSRTIFTERFRRLGQPVAWQRWRKP